jgi:hypothetical protein
VIGLLEWDQQVNMPTHGAEARSHHLSTLYRLYHLKFTSPELGRASRMPGRRLRTSIPIRTKPASSKSRPRCSPRRLASRRSG